MPNEDVDSRGTGGERAEIGARTVSPTYRTPREEIANISSALNRERAEYLKNSIVRRELVKIIDQQTRAEKGLRAARSGDSSLSLARQVVAGKHAVARPPIFAAGQGLAGWHQLLRNVGEQFQPGGDIGKTGASNRMDLFSPRAGRSDARALKQWHEYYSLDDSDTKSMVGQKGRGPLQKTVGFVSNRGPERDDSAAPSSEKFQPPSNQYCKVPAPISMMLSQGTVNYGVPSAELFDARIRTLQDRIRQEKDKGRKAELREYLIGLQRARQGAARNEVAAAREERAQRRDAGFEAISASAPEIEANRAKQDELRDELEDTKDRLKYDTEQQTRAIRKQIKGGSIGKGDGQARIQALNDAYEAQAKALDLATEAQVNRLEAYRVMAEATAKAAGQDGPAAKATVDRARARANELMSRADRNARRAQMAREDAEEVRKNVAGGGVGETRTNALGALGRLRNGRSGMGRSSRNGGPVRPGFYQVGTPQYGRRPNGDVTVKFPELVIPDGMQGVVSMQGS